MGRNEALWRRAEGFVPSVQALLQEHGLADRRIGGSLKAIVFRAAAAHGSFDLSNKSYGSDAGGCDIRPRLYGEGGLVPGYQACVTDLVADSTIRFGEAVVHFAGAGVTRITLLARLLRGETRELLELLAPGCGYSAQRHKQVDGFASAVEALLKESGLAAAGIGGTFGAVLHQGRAAYTNFGFHNKSCDGRPGSLVIQPLLYGDRGLITRFQASLDPVVADSTMQFGESAVSFASGMVSSMSFLRRLLPAEITELYQLLDRGGG